MEPSTRSATAPIRTSSSSPWPKLSQLAQRWPIISAKLTTKIQKLIATERIPPVPMFKRGHGACGGIVTLSAHPLPMG